MKYALLYQCGFARIISGGVCSKKRSLPEGSKLKIGRIMKLTALLFLVAFMQVSAGVYSQTVRLNENNSGLEKVFNEIRKQTGYNFLYNNRLLKNTLPVNIRVNGEELKSVLDRVFENQPLSYSIIDKTIVVKKRKPTAETNIPVNTQESLPTAALAKSDIGPTSLLSNRVSGYLLTAVDVSGKVTDDKGEPLPGVSIVIKGLPQGTTTSADGRFSLSVPGTSSVLIFSFVGYLPKEVPVGNKSVLDVTLLVDTKALEEVVVVGYGQMKRADLTTAQTSVSAKDIGRTVNTTIEQAIQGRAAGVYVTQNSGQPGGGISVNIRGVNSISGSNEPLYVVDGVQIPGTSVAYGSQSSSNPLAGLNPADIESIEVLQGPSATAIYGSRATNGVLIVTTKRGKSGDTKISYGYQYSLQTAPEPLTVMNLQQYAQMVGEYHQLAGGNTPAEFLDPSLLGKGTDWQKELFKSAPMNKHQLSLSGGNDKTTYYLSGEYLKQDGVA
ncbi:MAG: TonB-dependent receptor plug domain-containing protein, partial [Dyadobacter sp.]